MGPAPTFEIDARTGVVVVIVTYNSAKTIDACLGSVLRTISPEDEVVIVDNASRDETPIILQRYAAEFPCVRIILSDQNLGFAEGCNVGTRTSVKEFVCLLNPDTIVTPTWVDRMKVPFLTDGVAAVGPTSDNVAGLQKFNGYLPAGFSGNYSFDDLARILGDLNGFTHVETKLLTGFCLLLRRDVFEQMGLLDPELFLGCDDLDLCWRLQLAGYKLAIARDVFVHHDNHVSFNSESESVTKPLCDRSADHLARKLLAHYGVGNVPAQYDIWGMNWFVPTVEVWPVAESDAFATIGTYPAGDGTHFNSLGDLNAHSCYDQLSVAGVLEFSSDVVADLTKLVGALKVGGRLTIKIPHHLAPETWANIPYANLFGPKAWDLFVERPDLVGWTEFGLVHDGFGVLFSDFGSQLHFNRGINPDEVVDIPRTVHTIELHFRKVRLEGASPVKVAPGKPRLTLVIPTYKRRAMMMRQIDAILAQTVKDFEVFMVGDGCPEYAKLLADPFIQAKLQKGRDSGITIHAFNLEKNHGTPHKIINDAIQNAAGEFFIWTADDDYIAPTHVERYLAEIEGTHWDGVLINTSLLGDYYANVRNARLELGHAGHSELIVRTDVARKMPPHAASDFHDFEFIAAVAQGGKLAKAADGPTTYYVNLSSRQKHFNLAA